MRKARQKPKLRTSMSPENKSASKLRVASIHTYGAVIAKQAVVSNVGEREGKGEKSKRLDIIGT